MDEKINTDQIAQKLETQGDKIKYLRRLCGLSRKEFSDKYMISESTLRSWELNRSPISVRLMERFIEALSSEGFSISETWVRGNSTGTPTFVTGYSEKSFSFDEKSLEKEATFFLEVSPHRIVHAVEDSNNLPFFEKGSIVGGEILSDPLPDQVVDKFCLVQVCGSDKWSLHLVKPSPEKNLLTLASAQSMANPINFPILYNVNVERIAPVIWHRKTLSL